MEIQRQRENKTMEIQNDHKVIDKIVINLININNYSKYEYWTHTQKEYSNWIYKYMLPKRGPF